MRQMGILRIAGWYQEMKRKTIRVQAGSEGASRRQGNGVFEAEPRPVAASRDTRKTRNGEANAGIG